MDLYLLLISFSITLLASAVVRINYYRYKKSILNKSMTGFDVARKILDSNGLKDVLILETSGELTDHYDPTKKTVKLSKDVYNGENISACSIAAHECGHAIQDKEGYAFLVFRNKIIPFVNFSSKAGYIALLIGFLLESVDLIWLGIILELGILLFQVITLPVEFNASRRAINQLEKLNIVDNEEISGSKKVLISAAFTYVAGVLANLFELFRLVLIVMDRDR